MKKCESCGVFVSGQQRCPLCMGALAYTAEQTEEAGRPYPSYGKQRRRLLIWRLAAMLIVLACVISVLVNLAHPGPYTRAVVGYVIGGSACALLEMMLALHMRGSVARVISDQALIVSGLCVLWDVATGWHGWSVRYVVPLVLSCALCAMEIVRLCARQHFSDYGIRVLALSLVCLVAPLVLGMGWAGMVCAIAGAVAALELSFLEGKKLIAELRRRFHL